MTVNGFIYGTLWKVFSDMKSQGYKESNVKLKGNIIIPNKTLSILQMSLIIAVSGYSNQQRDIVMPM